jgi:hypothetical protein
VLAITCGGFEVQTLLPLRAYTAGLVVKVPSYEDRRVHGDSNLRPFGDGFRILHMILRERFRRREPLPAKPVGKPLPDVP